MGLEHEMMRRGRTRSEAFDQQRQEILHGRKGAVIAKTRIMFELQKRQVIGKAAGLDPPCRLQPVEPMQRHQGQPAQVKPELLRHTQAAMGAEMGIAVVCGQHEEMVKRAIEHMLAHIAPACRCIGQIEIETGQRVAHLIDAQRHDRRIAIRAATLIGHPIGA